MPASIVHKSQSASSDSTIANDTAAVAATLDPVVGIALELSQLHGRFNELEAQCFEAGRKGNVREQALADRERLNTSDAIAARRQLLTTMQARTMPGALVHASLLAAVIDIAKDGGPDEAHHAQDFREMARLAESVAAVLAEHSSGIDPLGKHYR